MWVAFPILNKQSHYSVLGKTAVNQRADKPGTAKQLMAQSWKGKKDGRCRLIFDIALWIDWVNICSCHKLWCKLKLPKDPKHNSQQRQAHTHHHKGIHSRRNWNQPLPWISLSIPSPYFSGLDAVLCMCVCMSVLGSGKAEGTVQGKCLLGRPWLRGKPRR